MVTHIRKLRNIIRCCPASNKNKKVPPVKDLKVGKSRNPDAQMDHTLNFAMPKSFFLLLIRASFEFLLTAEKFCPICQPAYWYSHLKKRYRAVPDGLGAMMIAVKWVPGISFHPLAFTGRTWGQSLSGGKSCCRKSNHPAWEGESLYDWSQKLKRTKCLCEQDPA